jgi:multiple sugar transport system permease protein
MRSRWRREVVLNTSVEQRSLRGISRRGREDRFSSRVSTRRRQQRTWVALALVGPIIVVVSFGGALVYDVVLSLQSVNIYQAGRFGHWVGLSNYRGVFHAGLGHVIFNTVIWQTLVSTLVKLILGFGLALVLRSRSLSSRFLRLLGRSMLIAVWAVPGVAATAVWRFMLSPKIGLFNEVGSFLRLSSGNSDPFASIPGSWSAIIALIVWNGLPLVVLVLLGAFESIPAETYEAALLDGASKLKQTLHITVPLSRSTLIVLGFLTFVELFNNFIYVWLTTGGGPGVGTQVLATDLYGTSFVTGNLGQGAAIGVLMSAAMAVAGLIYYLFVGRQQAQWHWR